MTPVLTPDLFFLTAQSLLDCVCDALNEESECPCPCRVFVSAGQPAWDDCCSGQLTAWVENIFYHEMFPSRQSTAASCGSILAGDLVVQLLRCAPTVGDDGIAPSGPVLSESARQLYQEMYIGMHAVTCCLSENRRDRLYVIRDAKTIGPNGGCAGWELRVTMQVLDPMP